MQLFFKIAFLLSLFFCSSPSLAETKKAQYLIEVGNINLGELFWEVSLTNKKYSMQITLKNKGLLTSLYKFKGIYEVSGNRQNDNIFPKTYKQKWKTNKKEREIEILFENNKVIKIIQNPVEKNLQRINYNEKTGLKDPLSSFLEIILNKKQSRTIDGRRTYLMKTELNKKNNFIKINIKEYENIWSDHKRLDLKYIELHQGSYLNNLILPGLIKIKFKGLVYKITKI